MSIGERPSCEAEAGSRDDDELTRVLADYLTEVEAGRAVDPEEWIEQHPAIAGRLRTCLAGLHLVEEFAGSIGSQMLNREPLADGPALGDFRIVRALGQGGMGVVYEAVQGSLDRRVALKVLPFGAAIDPRRLARFRVESQAAAQLNHPHIIPVYSVGSETGVHYYAMQFLDDQPIQARRPGVIERLTRLARKHMTLVMAVVPLLLLIVGGLTLGIVLVLAKQSQILKQQAEIRNQKIKAEALEKSARRQRDVARRAVDEMYTLVAQDWISRQINLQPLQRDFLQKALEYYREFASEKESDPGFRIAEGWAFYRLGDIQRRLGKLDEGERGYRQAIEALEALGEGKPPTPELVESLAGSYAGLGEVLDETGREEESKKALMRSVDLWRMLIDAIPETPANSAILAKRYEQLGTSLGRNGQYQEAEAAYRKAIELGKSSDQTVTFTEAQSTSNLAIALRKQGSLTEAQRLYREAVQEYEALINRAPGVPLYRERLAEALLNLGEALSKDSKDLESILRRARDVYQGLAADSPEVAEHRRNLGATLYNLASLLFSAGRMRESEAAARQARILLERLASESPTLVREQEWLVRSISGLAKVRTQAGQTAAALADATQARDLYDKLNPAAIDLGWDRAWNLDILAQLQEISGRSAEAEKSWRQAAAQFEALVEKAPGRLDLRSDLAHHLTQQALASARHGRKEEADRGFRRGVEILERVLSEAPERSGDRYRLAWAAHHFGNFLFQNGRNSEAERLSRVAFQNYERLFFEHYQQDAMVRACADCMSNAATSQLGMGRFADAVNSYSESLRLFDSLPPKLAFEPAVRDARGKVLDNLGKTLMLNGRFKEAEPRIAQALARRKAVTRQSPGGRLAVRETGTRGLRRGSKEQDNHRGHDQPRVVPFGVSGNRAARPRRSTPAGA